VTEFWQQVVSGVVTGVIYASLALALVLIYRSTRVINFAQGEMATFSTFIAWQLIEWGLDQWAAFFLTLAISFAGGVVLERVVIRPIEGASQLTIVIVTLGLFILIGGASVWIWSGETRAFARFFSTRPLDVGGVAFSIQDIGFVAVLLGAMALLYMLFQYTKVGLGLRAAALAPEPARLLGVRVSWMLALGWGLAALLGALSGMMTAAHDAQFDPNVMRPVLLYAFAAAVLGGLESPLGAVVGGLILGVALNLLGTYVDFAGFDLGGQLRVVAGFAVILVVLTFRPQGLFGRAAARRV
jgi:branched-chain amino acid transport system permease protein